MPSLLRVPVPQKQKWSIAASPQNFYSLHTLQRTQTVEMYSLQLVTERLEVKAGYPPLLEIKHGKLEPKQCPLIKAYPSGWKKTISCAVMYSAVSAAVESQRIQICPCFSCREPPRQPPWVLKLRWTDDTAFTVDACQTATKHPLQMVSIRQHWQMSSILQQGFQTPMWRKSHDSKIFSKKVQCFAPWFYPRAGFVPWNELTLLCLSLNL